MSWEIRQGDALERLREMPDRSVQMCATSPPYWGLRNYGVEGQIGLEDSLEEYVRKMTEVFEEVRRVLRDDGTCWINLGDSYAANRAYQVNGTKQTKNSQPRNGREVPPGLKPKDLIGIPWMVAFALRADGWYLRSDIIWAKANPMPESVTDRPTKAHEYIFLLTKSERYFYDAEAIKEPFANDRMGNPGAYKWKQGAGGVAGGGPNSLHKGDGTVAGWNIDGDKSGRNKRSVWTVNTQPCKEAHFATWPPKLVEIMVRAGSKEGDTVLDPFSGAATTGLVVLNLGRNYLGIELNPEYIEISKRRLSVVDAYQPGLFTESAL